MKKWPLEPKPETLEELVLEVAACLSAFAKEVGKTAFSQMLDDAVQHYEANKKTH
jgi:hypothetical protein